LQAYFSAVFAPLAVVAVFAILSFVLAASLTHAQLTVLSDSSAVVDAGLHIMAGCVLVPHAAVPRSAAEHTHQFAGHAARAPSHTAVLPLRLTFM